MASKKASPNLNNKDLLEEDFENQNQVDNNNKNEGGEEQENNNKKSPKQQEIDDLLQFFLEAQHNAILEIINEGGPKGILKKQLFADEILQLETFGEIPHRLAFDALKTYHEEAKLKQKREARNNKAYGSSSSPTSHNNNTRKDFESPLIENTMNSNFDATGYTAATADEDSEPWVPTSSFLVASSKRRMIENPKYTKMIQQQQQGKRVGAGRRSSASGRRRSSLSSASHLFAGSFVSNATTGISTSNHQQQRPASSGSAGSGRGSRPSSATTSFGGGGDWIQKLKQKHALEDAKEDKLRKEKEEAEKLTAASCVAYQYQYHWDM